jgi:pimeloyl-ACP methyl ester carboxylesterase
MIFCSVSPPLSASDLVREGRIAAEIEAAIMVGKLLQLEAEGVSFIGIYSEETTSFTQGAAIILHGRGAHPDWMDVVYPLRSQLPDYGWKTLSIQMPLAASGSEDWVYEALIPEAFSRIAAAVDYLKQQKVTNIVLIGHSLGARMGVAYLAQGAPKAIRAFVAVGLSADRRRPDEGTLGAMRQVRLPFIDLYGSQDLASVVETTQERALAARLADNPAYRQTEIAGADHFFRGLDDTLVARVRAWMGRVAPGQRVKN